MLVAPAPFDEQALAAMLDDTEQALADLGVEMDIEAFLVVVEELAYNAMQRGWRETPTPQVTALR